MSYTIKSALFLDKYCLRTLIKTITYILKLIGISHNLNEGTYFIIKTLITIILCIIFCNIYYIIFLICLYFSLSNHDYDLIMKKLTTEKFYFIIELTVCIFFCIILCIIEYIIIYIIFYCKIYKLRK
jgi:hypothetical protein